MGRRDNRNVWKRLAIGAASAAVGAAVLFGGDVSVEAAESNRPQHSYQTGRPAHSYLSGKPAHAGEKGGQETEDLAELIEKLKETAEDILERVELPEGTLFEWVVVQSPDEAGMVSGTVRVTFPNGYSVDFTVSVELSPATIEALRESGLSALNPGAVRYEDGELKLVQ